MSALTVLQAARDAGTAFEVNGDRLTVDIPETAPDRIVDLLRAHKAEIITLLRAEALVDEAWRAGISFGLSILDRARSPNADRSACAYIIPKARRAA